MKIRFKFTIGLFIILLTFGLGLNLLIRQVLIEIWKEALRIILMKLSKAPENI